ncbi:MAG: dihydroorotase, partial [Candidatus Omnitrophica bacterium]|nr:dihydroorotase [Candidatus Omnitrophota bacterium]
MRLLIKDGYLIDPKNKRQGQFDILIENSRIKKIASHIQEPCDTLIDANKKVILPGLIDIHVHLRQPGREDKETILSGTLS